MSEIDYEGRVAIVTGAGAGLGRAHALALGKYGARVVVNDLAGEPSAADAVVAEIVDAGGEAVASCASVGEDEGAAQVVADAVAAFGQVDVVVNNAGITRDRSFAKLEADAIDAVLRVHLYGTIGVTKAAWEHLKASGAGRVINTTSGARLFGNFGQANYSAAKMGIVGLSRTLAIEGAKAGIGVNVVAPFAASQMTEQVMSPEEFAALKPELVSPMVVYLGSSACETTGQIFTVAGGFVARVAILEGEGVNLSPGLTPDTIADAFDQIVALGNATEPQNVIDSAHKVNRAIGV